MSGVPLKPARCLERVELVLARLSGEKVRVQIGHRSYESSRSVAGKTVSRLRERIAVM